MLLLGPAAAEVDPVLRALFGALPALLPAAPAEAIAALILWKVAAAAADFLGGLPRLLLWLRPLVAILLIGGVGLPPTVTTFLTGLELPGAMGILVPPGGSGLLQPLLPCDWLRRTDIAAGEDMNPPNSAAAAYSEVVSDDV
jgi:hypothetical protein